MPLFLVHNYKTKSLPERCSPVEVQEVNVNQDRKISKYIIQ